MSVFCGVKNVYFELNELNSHQNDMKCKFSSTFMHAFFPYLLWLAKINPPTLGFLRWALCGWWARTKWRWEREWTQGKYKVNEGKNSEKWNVLVTVYYTSKYNFYKLSIVWFSTCFFLCMCSLFWETIFFTQWVYSVWRANGFTFYKYFYQTSGNRQ